MTRKVFIAIVATSILSTGALAQTEPSPHSAHPRRVHPHHAQARADVRSSLASAPGNNDTVRRYDDGGTMPWQSPEGDSLKPEDWRSEANGN